MSIVKASDGHSIEGQSKDHITVDGHPGSVQFDPESQHVLVSDKQQGWVWRFKIATGDLVAAIDLGPGHSFNVNSTADRLLVLPRSGRGGGLWDATSGREVESFDWPPSTQAKFDPSGKRFCAWGKQMTLRVYDAADAAPGLEFGRLTNYVSAPRFIDNGSHLATVNSVGSETRLSIYDVNSGELQQQLLLPQTRVRDFAVSDNRERAITNSSDGTIQLWDLKAAKEAIILMQSDYGTARFGPRPGQLLSWQYNDPALILRDARNGAALMTFSARDQPISYVTFDPQSPWMISQGKNGEVRLWPTDPLSIAERTGPRKLTPQERMLWNIGSPDDWASDVAADNRARLLRDLDVLKKTMRDNPDFYLTLACDHRMRELRKLVHNAKDRDAAISIARELVAAGNRKSPWLLLALAELQHDRGNTVDAVRLLEEADRLPDSTMPVRSQLAAMRQELAPLLVSTASIDAAVKQHAAAGSLDDLRSKFPEDSPYLRDYFDARVRQERGDFNSAKPAFEKLLSQHPASVDCAERLAECRAALAGPEAARPTLGAFLSDPQHDDSDAWLNWARLSLGPAKFSPRKLLESRLLAPYRDASSPPSGEAPTPFQLAWLLQCWIDGKPARINCGGPTFVQPDGDVWHGDTFYRGGRRYFELGDGTFGHYCSEISDTDNDLLYQSERWFPPEDLDVSSQYRIPAPPGRYRVRFHFAELYLRDNVTERRFGIWLEGQEVRSNYSLENGRSAAAEQIEFDVRVDDGMLEVGFTLIPPRQPRVNGLEIIPLGGNPASTQD